MTKERQRMESPVITLDGPCSLEEATILIVEVRRFTAMEDIPTGKL